MREVGRGVGAPVSGLRREARGEAGANVAGGRVSAITGDAGAG